MQVTSLNGESEMELEDYEFATKIVGQITWLSKQSLNWDFVFLQENKNANYEIQVNI